MSLIRDIRILELSFITLIKLDFSEGEYSSSVSRLETDNSCSKESDLVADI